MKEKKRIDVISLRPNPDLLEPEFEGYKLTSDPFPIHKKKLDNGFQPCHISPGKDQYSYIHIKLLSLHNHLIGDPWHHDSMYYIADGGQVIKISGFHDSIEPKTVFKFQDAEGNENGNKRNETLDTQVCLSFPNSCECIISSGNGFLYLLETGDRGLEPSTWKLIGSVKISDCPQPMILAHSLSVEGGIHCVLLHVDEITKYPALEELKHGHPSVTGIRLVHLKKEQEKKLEIKNLIMWVTLGNVMYTAVEDKDHVLIAADKTVYTIDACTGDIHGSVKEQEIEDDKYVWEQEEGDVRGHFRLEEGVKSTDLEVKIEEFCLKVTKGEQLLVEGEWGGTINKQESSWEVVGERLTLKCKKYNKGEKWEQFLKGSSGGVELQNQVDLQDRLKKLSCLMGGPNSLTQGGTSFNSQQLEDCDEYPSEYFCLEKWNVSCKNVTHKVSLGDHQWLLTCSMLSDSPPAFCVRHDVDGVVWQPEPNVKESWSCKHVGTFHALGYVQAGKEQRKFSVCSPILNYAAICDVKRHVYVYKAPCQLGYQLQNRKTGKKIKKVAYQQVINLEANNEEILGLFGGNNRLFVLTSTLMYAVHIM